ncbi:MAG TPA: hypothetical protein PLI57_09200, partial [Spirochaetota bacterium]|nr:hypothetical protein [Spirochaetota bacterium]
MNDSNKTVNPCCIKRAEEISSKAINKDTAIFLFLISVSSSIFVVKSIKSFIENQITTKEITEDA